MPLTTVWPSQNAIDSFPCTKHPEKHHLQAPAPGYHFLGLQNLRTSGDVHFFLIQFGFPQNRICNKPHCKNASNELPMPTPFKSHSVLIPVWEFACVIQPASVKPDSLLEAPLISLRLKHPHRFSFYEKLQGFLPIRLFPIWPTLCESHVLPFPPFLVQSLQHPRVLHSLWSLHPTSRSSSASFQACPPNPPTYSG